MWAISQVNRDYARGLSEGRRPTSAGEGFVESVPSLPRPQQER